MQIISAVHFSVTVATFILGILIVLRNPRSRINISFGVMTFSMASWMLMAYVSNILYGIRSDQLAFYTYLAFGSFTPFPSMFIYFTCVFPDDKPIDFLKTLLILSPIPVMYLLLFNGLIYRSATFPPGGGFTEIFGPLAWLFLTYFILGFGTAYLILAKKYRELRDTARIQILYVITGTIIPAVIGGTSNLFIPIIGITSYWQEVHATGPIASSVFILSIALAIIRYRFMGFGRIVGKGLVYTILASSITAFYFGFLYVTARFFQAISGNYSFILGLVFFFFLALIFNPLRDRLQVSVDGLFFKTKFDYEKALKETSSAMSVVADRDRLLKLTARLVTRRMKLSGAALFIINEKHDRYEVIGADGAMKDMLGATMSSNYPLIEHLEDEKGIISRADLENRLSTFFISENEEKKTQEVFKDMERITSSVCVPSMFKGKMLAFLALGPKLSGDSITAEDSDFLMTLANQNAVFLENSRLLEKEKESVKVLAEAQAREKYTSQLEKINKELVETREELLKSERLSTLTKLTISLQREINAPLSDLLARTTEMTGGLSGEGDVDVPFAKEKLSSIERESKRIRELLHNLANITEPIVKDYAKVSYPGGIS